MITSRRPLWWRRFWPLIGASSPVPSPLFPPVRSSYLFFTPSIPSGNPLSPPFVTTSPSSLPSTFSHPVPQTLIIPVNPQRMSGVFQVFPSSGPSSRIPSPEGPGVWNAARRWRIIIMSQKQPPTPTRQSPPASSLCPYVPMGRLKRTVTKDESLCHSDNIIAPIMASRRHKTVGYDNTWAAKWFIPVLQTQAELQLIMSYLKKARPFVS